MILINDDQNRMLKIHVNDRLLINITRWYIATGCWWSYFQAKCYQVDFARWNNVSYGYFQHVEEVDCYPNICDYGIGWKKFSMLQLLENPSEILRCIISQERLNTLPNLCIEMKLLVEIGYYVIINNGFTSKTIWRNF